MKNASQNNFTNLVRIVTITDVASVDREVSGVWPDIQQGSNASCFLQTCKSKKQSNLSRNVTIWGYADVINGAQERGYINKLNEVKGYGDILMKELHTCCRLNCVRRIQILVDIIQQINKIDLSDVKYEDPHFESPLMLSVACESLEATMYLIQKGGKQIITKVCQSNLYKGANVLHLAIMSGNCEAIITMLQAFDTDTDKIQFIDQYASGCVFQSMGMSGSPCHLALQCAHVDIYFILIDNGGEMDSLDPITGNTAIHTIIDYGKNDPNYAKHLLDQFFGNPSTKAWFCRKFTISIKEYSDQDDCDMKNFLLKIANKDGYTPLTYSAKLGVYPIMMELLQCEGVYMFTQWRLGSMCQVMYDLAEVDPAVATMVRPGKPTVLELLLYKSDDDVPLTSQHAQPLKDLITRKWDRHFVMFLVWMLFYTVYIVLFTFAVDLNIPTILLKVHVFLSLRLPEDGQEPTLTRMQTLTSSQTDNRTLAEFLTNETSNELMFCYIIFAIESVYGLFILYSVYASLKLLILGRVTPGRQYRAPWSVILRLNEYKFVFVLHICSTLTWTIMLYSHNYINNDNFIFIVIMSLILGWMYLFHFAQAYESTSYFTIMVKRIFVTDLVRFCVVVCIFLNGFAVILLLFATADNLDPPSAVSSLSGTVDTLFLLMVGAGNVDYMDEIDGKYQTQVAVMSFIFLILSAILLLNMVIAAMSDTYMCSTANRKNLFWKMRMQAVNDMERFTWHYLIRYFVVAAYSQYDIDKDTWLMPVKEVVLKDQ